jgi:PAS domain S-box-containing protein
MKTIHETGMNGTITPGSANTVFVKGCLAAAPYIVLALSLAMTLFFWRLYDVSLKTAAFQLYTDKTEEITSRIVRGMHDNEQILWGGAGLFNAGNLVSRDEWRRFVATLKLGESYPGIQGVGFSRWITLSEKETNIRAIRSEGFPEYSIRPEGERPVYTSIIYLEPFDWRNQRAFGYDMFSEPMRRSAMEKARDSGETHIAAGVTLVQETDRDKQSGMLMYVPVYRQGMPTDSVEKRRSAILGFVYSPIRVSDFVYATLGKMPQNIAFELYAADAEQSDALMFSSIAAEKLILPQGYTPAHQNRQIFEAYGRKWLISFKTLPPFTRELHRGVSYAVLAGGILISLLLTLVVFMLNAARIREFEAAQAIAESEEKFRTLVNNLSSGVVVHGPDSAILFSNPMASTLLGLTYDQMRGKQAIDPAWGFLQENGAPMPLEEYPVNRVLSSGEPIASQILGIRRSDRTGPVWVQYNAYPVLDANSHILQVVVTFSDITDLKEYEQELQDKNTELERFAYIISHDLKSPIITIKGFTGSLERDLLRGNHERMAGDLKRVSDAADRMNDLLRDLLELSTIGRIINTPVVVDMNLLVADVLAQLAGPLKNHNMTVAVQTDLPTVFCDKRRMAEVLQNLIENAVNYMGEQAEPQIQFGMREEDGENIFFVQDNGIGIDPRHHEKVFGLFNKLDASSSGTGIGLALVNRIIKAHGGRVWVESEGEGLGSRFCFTVGHDVNKEAAR